jgi:hypothetical protein
LSFDDATEEVRSLVEKITLEDCFKQETWKQMTFFARVRPDKDVFPVRAEYSNDGTTKNIAINYLTDSEPVWLSGPDLVASKLPSEKLQKLRRQFAWFHMDDKRDYVQSTCEEWSKLTQERTTSFVEWSSRRKCTRKRTRHSRIS